MSHIDSAIEQFKILQSEINEILAENASLRLRNERLAKALEMMILAYEMPYEIQPDYRNEYFKAKQALKENEGE